MTEKPTIKSISLSKTNWSLHIINREFKRLNPNLGLDFVQADKIYNDPRTSIVEKERLKPLLSEVKLLFPQKLSEAEPSKTN